MRSFSYMKKSQIKNNFVLILINLHKHLCNILYDQFSKITIMFWILCQNNKSSNKSNDMFSAVKELIFKMHTDKYGAYDTPL